MNPEIKSAFLRILPFIVVLLVLFIRIQRKRMSTQDLHLQAPNSIASYFTWVLGFLALVLMIEVIFYQCGILEVDKWNHSFYPSIIRIFGAIILAPIAEELLFRGIILDKLVKQKLNMHLAIFIQAVFFVLLHNFTYEFTLSSNIAIVQGLLDASLFAYARYSTQSIYTPITMHMTGNLIATLERFIF